MQQAICFFLQKMQEKPLVTRHLFHNLRHHSFDDHHNHHVDFSLVVAHLNDHCDNHRPFCHPLYKHTDEAKYL